MIERGRQVIFRKNSQGQLEIAQMLPQDGLDLERGLRLLCLKIQQGKLVPYCVVQEKECPLLNDAQSHLLIQLHDGRFGISAEMLRSARWNRHARKLCGGSFAKLLEHFAAITNKRTHQQLERESQQRDEEMKNDECLICQQEQVTDWHVTDCCERRVHARCFTAWLVAGGESCPHCREPIDVVDMMLQLGAKPGGLAEIVPALFESHKEVRRAEAEHESLVAALGSALHHIERLKQELKRLRKEDSGDETEEDERAKRMKKRSVNKKLSLELFPFSLVLTWERCLLDGRHPNP